MENKQKPTPSELDTRTQEDNKRTINRLLNLYDTMLDEYTILMQEPEYEGSPTYVDKLNMLKKLASIANPLMRRWNIIHQGYDSSVRIAQAKQDNDSTSQANTSEQNDTNEILHIVNIKPGVMQKITVSGENETSEIIKVKEIEPDVFEVIDPPGRNEIIDLKCAIKYHPDMLEIIKSMPPPLQKNGKSVPTFPFDTATAALNVPDT